MLIHSLICHVQRSNQFQWLHVHFELTQTVLLIRMLDKAPQLVTTQFFSRSLRHCACFAVNFALVDPYVQ